MPVTFQVVGNLADFGNDVRAGVKVRATATPGVKVGDVAVHSNQPETVVTDAAGAFTLELVSLPGVWYRIQTPYANGINTVNLAGYVPDVGDPTTGTAFPALTVINLKDVVSEDPTPGYEAITVGATSVNGQVGTIVLDAADVGAATAAQGAKADTAVQPGALATVATTGAYADLAGKPTIPDSPDDIGAAATSHTHDDRYYTETEADARFAPATQPVNAQTGTTYTLAASDAGKLVTLTNAAAITLTVPASVFTAGQRVDVLVAGAGMVTATAGSGLTLNGTPTLVSRSQWSAFTVLFTSATAAVVVGDLASA